MLTLGDMQYHIRILKDELESRLAKNGRYSLRAFAYNLNMHPSALSRVLSGKAELSPKSALAVSKKLGLDGERTRLFLQSLVETRGHLTASKLGKAIGFPELRPQPSRIPDEAYDRIGAIEYIALTELTRTSDFRPDPEWISSRLGLPAAEVSTALALLVDCGLLEREGDTFKKFEMHTTAVRPSTSEMRRRHQEDLLERAKQALASVPSEQRANYTVCLPINLNKLPEAVRLTERYLEKMCDLFETGERTEVYQLAVQLFPVTESTP